MKGWINNLAMFCLIASTANSAQAQSSIVEYPKLHRQFATPVIIENNEPSDESVSAARESISGITPVRKTPYFVEFGSVSQPVSLQPPNIRPSGSSPHIQEFSVLPLDDLQPAAGAYAITNQFNEKAHNFAAHKHSKSFQSSTLSHRSSHQALHGPSAQLVPVDKLAIFPISDRPQASSSRNTNNLLSGKNRSSL